MNHQTPMVSQLEIDQLVDGGLTGNQYRELIQRLDVTPDGWKHCALTFLEHQALACDFATMVGDQQVAELMQTDRFLGESSDSDTHSQNPADTKLDSTFDRAVEHHQRVQHGFAGHFLRNPLFLAAAASFLIAFFLGMGANPVFFPGQAKPVANGGTPPNFDNNDSGDESLPLILQDKFSGTQRKVALPVVSGTNSNLASALEQQLPKPVGELIKQANVPYEVRRNMVPLVNAEGKVFYVPVDQIKFRQDLAQYQ